MNSERIHTPPPPPEVRSSLGQLPVARGRRSRVNRRARIRIGCCGWHYAEWRGMFYDEGTKQDDELSAYAEQFDTVEIDSTYYGVPAESTVLLWKQRTPERFSFSAKFPRTITHEARLVGVVDELDRFCDAMRALGPKLAALVIQLPPSFTFRDIADLDRFLDDLPTDIRFALEVRHRSWLKDETYELLRNHRVAWVISDMNDIPIVPMVTADFAYIRWLGSRDDVEDYRQETVDRTGDLLRWRDHVRDIATQVSDIFGFFSNTYAGHAPSSGVAFKEMLGLPVRRRDRWRQASLLDGIV